MPKFTEQSAQVLAEREQGDTYEAIAARHNLTHQRVGAIVRTAREFVSEVEDDLLGARLETKRNPADPQAYAYVIPFGPGYDAATAFIDWVVRELRRRGNIEVKVETRPARNGVLWILEDVTDYGWGDQ